MGALIKWWEAWLAAQRIRRAFDKVELELGGSQGV